jgi:ribosomal protein S18 acetylase RimI-like enzyme
MHLFNNFSANQTAIVQPPLDKVIVREFLPQTSRDPILPIIRELFVRSFDQFYKEIETQLKLKTNKSLVEWLQETFDEMQDEMLTKKCRCFMLCSSDDTIKNDDKQGIIGFLTLKEEEKGSVYIAQCAVDAESKRRGYGARLLQYLRTLYPPGTFYWGLCRRANIPAVKFYLKQGAKFMDDEEVANKYGYDPKLYTGFEFTDGSGNFQSR